MLGITDMGDWGSALRDRSASISSFERAGTRTGPGYQPYADCPSVVPAFREQRYSGQKCVPHVFLLSQPCNRETLFCWMFRIDAYLARQSELRSLIARKPGASGTMTYAGELDWCESVLRAASRALDATNLQPWLIRATGLLSRWTAMRRSLNLGPFHRGTGDEWSRRATQSRIEPAIDFEISGKWETNESFDGPGVVSGGDYTGQITYPAGTDVYPRIHPTDREGARVNARIPALIDGKEIAVRAWSANPRADMIAGWFRDRCHSHTVPCTAADRSQCCNSGTRYNGFLLGRTKTIDLCAALANDIINTPFIQWTAEGAIKFLEALQPFVDRGEAGMTRTQFLQAQRDAARAKADSTAAEFSGSAATVGAIAGGVGAIFMSIAGAITLFLAHFLPLAAGWSCPPVPFKRTYDPSVAPECSFSNAFRDDMLPSFRDRFRQINVTGGMILFDPRSTGCPPDMPGCTPGYEPPVTSFGTKLLLGAGALVAGGLIVKAIRARSLK